MTVDWVSIGIAIVSALLTAIIHRTATATPAVAPAPAPIHTAATGGLFHGGLLHRLSGSANSTSSASATNTNTGGSATGHPVLDSIVSMLQSVVATNPGLLTSLQGVLVQLATPSGTVNLNLSNTGGTTNASQQTPTTAVSASVAASS